MNLARTNSTERVPYFRLRVLLEYDKVYGVFAAHCLETGNVVTADTPEDAKNMIKELLEDEINFALERKSFRNLLGSPAPKDVWDRWTAAAKDENYEIETIPLNVTAREIELNQDEVDTEVKLVQTAAAA